MEEENELFLYEKRDGIFDENLKQYLKSIGKISLFSLEEEIAAGREMLKRRGDVLKALCALKYRKNGRIVKTRKTLHAKQVCLKGKCHIRQQLEKKENIWDFVTGFLMAYGCWPSCEKMKSKFREWGDKNKMALIRAMHLESLSEECKLRFYLENKKAKKEVQAVNLRKRFYRLHPAVLSRVLHEFENEEIWKYWQAYIFDELETFSCLPNKIFTKMKSLADIEARFVEANLRLSIMIAKKYSRNCFAAKIDFLDLIQEGNLALYDAARKFNPAMGNKFSTFAIWWIRQSIQRTIDNDSNTIRIPVGIIEKFKKLKKLSIQMTYAMGQEPTAEELAKKAIEEFPDLFKYLTSERVKHIFSITKGVASLDKPIQSPEIDDEETSLGSLIKDKKAVSPEDNMIKKSLEEAIDKIFSKILKKKEIEVINLRFGRKGNASHTLEEVGTEFGLTRERIRQIESCAISKLRRSPRKEILRSFLFI